MERRFGRAGIASGSAGVKTSGAGSNGFNAEGAEDAERRSGGRAPPWTLRVIRDLCVESVDAILQAGGAFFLDWKAAAQ